MIHQEKKKKISFIHPNFSFDTFSLPPNENYWHKENEQAAPVWCPGFWGFSSLLEFLGVSWQRPESLLPPLSASMA